MRQFRSSWFYHGASLGFAIGLWLLLAAIAGCATDQGLPMVTSRGERIIYVGPKEFYPNIRKGDVENYRCLAGVLWAESHDGFHFDLRCMN